MYFELNFNIVYSMTWVNQFNGRLYFYFILDRENKHNLRQILKHLLHIETIAKLILNFHRMALRIFSATPHFQSKIPCWYFIEQHYTK